MENEWIINPNLRIMQSKLLQPNVVANGRWTIHSALNNISSVAVGKDTFPKVIELLLNLSKSKQKISEILDSRTFEILKKK